RRDLRQHLPGGRDRHQPRLDEILGNRIDAGWVHDTLSREGGIRLEVGIFLKKVHYRAVGLRARAIRPGGIAAQFGGDEYGYAGRRPHLGLALPLIADEEKDLVAPVELGENYRSSHRGSELVAFENRARLPVTIIKERIGVERVIAEVIVCTAVD